MGLFDKMKEQFQKEANDRFGNNAVLGGYGHGGPSNGSGENSKGESFLLQKPQDNSISNNNLGVTPQGSNGNSDGKDENDTPNEFAQFEPIPEQVKKLGPVPVELDDVQRNKLRLGQKVGIFYFQYTLLKRTLQIQTNEIPLAPRGIAAHKVNEPDEVDHPSDRNYKRLERYGQPQKALSNAEQSGINKQAEEKKNIANAQNQILKSSKAGEIPSFIYTSAHVRDLEVIKQMAGELATFDRQKEQLDPRDPSF